MTARSIDVGTSIGTVILINASMVIDEGAVSYHCRALVARGVQADDQTPS